MGDCCEQSYGPASWLHPTIPDTPDATFLWGEDWLPPVFLHQWVGGNPSSLCLPSQQDLTGRPFFRSPHCSGSYSPSPVPTLPGATRMHRPTNILPGSVNSTACCPVTHIRIPSYLQLSGSGYIHIRLAGRGPGNRPQQHKPLNSRLGRWRQQLRERGHGRQHQLHRRRYP